MKTLLVILTYIFVTIGLFVTLSAFGAWIFRAEFYTVTNNGVWIFFYLVFHWLPAGMTATDVNNSLGGTELSFIKR